MNIHPTEYTAQENLIAECLSDLGFRYEQQTHFSRYRVDFWIPELKLVIEADGVYWHLKKRDTQRDIELMENSSIEYIFHIRADTKKRIEEELWRALNKL